MYRVMRFLEGISFQLKHETVLDSAHVTSQCEHNLPLASTSSHFQLTFLSLYTFSSSSFFSFNYLVCLCSVIYLLPTEQVSFWFIFGRCLLRILAWPRTILNQDFQSFPQFLQTNSGKVPFDRFLPRPFQLINHFHSIIRRHTVFWHRH
jgi:hypothetical protein